MTKATAEAMSEEGYKKPEVNSWKPGSPGDAIKGIFTGIVRQFEGQYGVTHIYDVLGIEGSFHNIDEDGKPTDEVVTILPGQTYAVFERSTFADDIKRAKAGQRIIIRFTELRKPKSGGKPYKMVECLLGPMDEEWLKENKQENNNSEPF